MSTGFRGRRARVVLVGPDGRVLGCLASVELAEPWWMLSHDLLALLKERFGLEAVVLRLLAASAPRLEPGADVVYALETAQDLPAGLPLEPCPAEMELGDDADLRRMPWARLGGVREDVAWADRELSAMGRPRTRPLEQVRTWNLSLLLRLPTGPGPVWLKHVPGFFAHEGSVIALVGECGWPGAPPLLAVDPGHGRMLLDDVPGTDQYLPPRNLLAAMVESLVDLQRLTAGSGQRLLGTGAPDWRAPALSEAASALAGRADVRADLDPSQLRELDALVGELPARLEALYSCGLEDGLVHGDFHPGNHRFDGRRLVLLDWGDSGIGHPLLDMTAFMERVPSRWDKYVSAVWARAWSRSIAEADFARAAELIRPVGALRQAIIYRRFLDAIEPSEHVYHREDPGAWLRTAIELGASHRGGR